MYYKITDEIWTVYNGPHGDSHYTSLHRIATCYLFVLMYKRRWTGRLEITVSLSWGIFGVLMAAFEQNWIKPLVPILRKSIVVVFSLAATPKFWVIEKMGGGGKSRDIAKMCQLNEIWFKSVCSRIYVVGVFCPRI